MGENCCERDIPGGTYPSQTGNILCQLNSSCIFQVSTLVGHEDAVQSVVFDSSGNFLVSGGSDMTVRIWS